MRIDQHPLSEKESLTRKEWMDYIRFEGMVGIYEDNPDMEMLRQLEADCLVEILPLHGHLSVCITEKGRRLSPHGKYEQ